VRSILKGPGTDYTAQVPVAFTWQRLNNKKQVTLAYTALTTAFGITSDPDPLVVTVTDALAGVLQIIKIQTPTDAQKEAKKAILERASDVWKLASGPLIAALGSFCAYCETSIPGLVEVDHVANKASFPTFALDWENFLPSCGPCNNRKSDDPNRATVAAYPPALPPTAPENEFNDALLDHFHWPHTREDTYQFFLNRLLFQAADGTWHAVGPLNAANLAFDSITSVDVVTRVIRANVAFNGVLLKNVRVWVNVNPEGEDLVDLCKLNDPGDASASKTYDRRAFNRTLNWFKALNLLYPLSTIATSNFAVFWTIVMIMAGVSGFWSSWLTILSSFADPLRPGHSLGFAFWNYSVLPGTPFPGTNPAGLQTINIAAGVSRQGVSDAPTAQACVSPA
jgi:hypothetical protein